MREVQMAGDEEVDAVARALMKHWVDQANAERYIGGPHTSPMVEPEEYDIDDPPDGMEEQARLDAEVVIAALDCVRSRPAGSTTGGTEGEDHEAGIEAMARARIARWLNDAPAVTPSAFLEAFPACGTESDTAKLADAYERGCYDRSRAIVAWLRERSGRPSTTWSQLAEKVEREWVERELLAGFSVDAGKPHEHEWVDARNSAVESGEVCLGCGAVRSGPDGR